MANNPTTNTKSPSTPQPQPKQAPQNQPAAKPTPKPTKKPRKKLPLPKLTTLHLLIILTSLLIIQLTTISLLSTSLHHQQLITNLSPPAPPSYNFTLEQLENYPNLKNKLQTALPTNSQIITLIEYLTTVASNFNSQVNVETNEPLTSPDAPAPYITFSINGRLNPENFVKLTQQIEQPSFLIDIINIQATTPTGINQNIEFTIKARAYVSSE
jgi:hypothetical protein